MKPIIEFEAVDFRYRRAPVLEQVSFTLEANQFAGIVGPNGSGKTTLLKLLLGLLEPDAGSVRVFGKPPVDARRRIGYVPQFAGFKRDFPITVLQVVLMGRLGAGSHFGRHRRLDYEAARAALAQVQIERLEKSPIGDLSGGELQRVLIARALASDPDILLLDEPTANVDTRVETNLFEELKTLSHDKTVLVVSHDVGFISHYVSQVVCVNRNVVVHPTAALTSEAIESLYGAPQRRVHGHAQGLHP